MTILCTIDLLTREVFLPANQRIAAYDHNVDIIHFQAEPVEDFSFDLSSIRIAAKGPNKARHDYPVDPSTVSIEEETGYITFDWPIPQGVTEMPEDTFGYGATGQLIFAVCAEIISGSTLSKAWHSDDGIITVVAHLEPEAGGGEDPEEEATNRQKIGQLQTDVAVMRTQIGAVAGGVPTVVDSVSDMTDTGLIYILSMDGKWYYHDGTTWTAGGTYGGAVTDTTLSISGAAADAKAVRDALAGKADADDVDAIDDRVTAVEGGIVETNERLEELSPSKNSAVYISTGYMNIDVTDSVRSISYDDKSGTLSFKYSNNISTSATAVNPSVRTLTHFDVDPSVEPYVFNVNFAKHPFLLVKRSFKTPANENYSDYLGFYAKGIKSDKFIKIFPSMLSNGVVDLYDLLYKQTGDGIIYYNTLALYGIYATTVPCEVGEVELVYSIDGIMYQNDVADGITLSDTVAELTYRSKNAEIFAKDCYQYRNIIPSYYFAKPENPTDYTANEYLEGKIAEIPDGKHFIFLTDTHVDPLAHDGRFTNALQSIKLIQYIRKRTGIKTVVFGGDVLNRANTKYIANMWLKSYMNELISAFGDDIVYCHGNHDMNTANIDSISGMTIEEAYAQYMIPYEEVYHDCFEPFNEVVNYDTNFYKFDTIADSADLKEMVYYNRFHFFVDDNENKVRYINLYTGTANNGIVRTYTNTYAYGETILQVPWLYEVLKTVPEGYDVVCVGHQMLQPSSFDAVSDSVRVPIRLLCARKSKVAFSYELPARGVYYDAGTRTFDFTGLPNIGKVILVTGHYHVDNAVLFTIDENGTMTATDPSGTNIGNGVIGTITQCDAYGQTVTGSAEMVKDTISEGCFDVVTYNESGVYFTRIGAGQDRGFLF